MTLLQIYVRVPEVWGSPLVSYKFMYFLAAVVYSVLFRSPIIDHWRRMLQDFFNSDADRTSNPCSSCLGHDAGFILHTLGMRGLHRRLLQNQSLCHSVTVHQPSVLKYLHLCHEGWMSFLVSDRHIHLHPCIAVFSLSWLVFGAAWISTCLSPISSLQRL